MRPAFLIIGAQKAGTSALFSMLAAHQAIAAPAVKELHFFDRDDAYARGWRHYLTNFPRSSRNAGKLTFEATPGYLFSPTAPQRVQAHLPQARIVAVLRDPVARAFSAWNMFRDFAGPGSYGHLHDPRSFEQAIDDELSGRSTPHAHAYIARGEYAVQLARWFDRFGRDRVLVFSYPQLRAEPEAVVNAIVTASGLAPFHGDPTVFARRRNTRPYLAPMDPAVRERLEHHFAPHHERLERLLGHAMDLKEP